MKSSKLITETEQIENGNPCKHETCGKLKTQCPQCGRIKCRGNVFIQNRTGYVHYERLNSTNIKLHNKLPHSEQELNTIKLWIGPNY